FGALTFVAMGKHEGQTALAAPLGFARRNELVDDNLCAIDEIAELGFPDGKRVGFCCSVTIFKRQDRLFGQYRVDNGKRRLLFGHILQGNIGTVVPAVTLLVVQYGMSVRKGAATGVLPGNAHGIARRHKSCERQMFAHTPVEASLAAGHLEAVVQQLVDQRMNGKAFGDRGDFFANAGQLGQRHTSIGLIGPFGVQERGPVGGVFALVIGKHLFDSALAFFHELTIRLDHVVGLVRAQDALRHQLFGVQLAGTRMLTDALVHQRLRQRGSVLFVMAQFAEANDINHDVVLELAAIIKRQLRNVHDSFGIVAVDVEHRRFDHLDHVGTVQCRTGVARIGGSEADLVVDDDVHRSAGTIAAGLRKVERFHDNALACKGRVAVDEHRQYLAAIGILATILTRTHAALNHRIDDFEVGRVECQGQMNGTAARGKVAGEPVVILDVAIGKRLAVLAFEFGEQITGHLAHDVDEHVEATAVRHAYNDFLDSVFAGMVDQFVHRDDEALAAFQREALLTHILGMQVTLEAFGIGKLLQYAGFTLGGKRGYSDGGLETFLDPALGGRIGNMHEFGTDSSTIRIAQR